MRNEEGGRQRVRPRRSVGVPSRRWRGVVALAAALGAGASLSAAAHAVPAGSQQATDGAVTATLSWQGSKEEYDGVRAPRLKLERAGVIALDAGIGDLCDRCFFYGDAKDPNVQVADLDGDAEPEALVTTFTGGAHCCTDVGIWDFRANFGTYGHLVRNFGNGGYRLEDLDGDGRRELFSVDDRFAYSFAPYVFSARPPQILRWSRVPQVGLTDVTREFPQVIRKDAAELRRVLRGRAKGVDLRGSLAAYVADMYLLDRGREGRAEIARVRRRSRLGRSGDRAWPGGRRFEPALLAFLKEAGYR
ncbi:MAG: hypothetical protein ACR2NB_08345 [Solirubrobacteraceae bacterium]